MERNKCSVEVYQHCVGYETRNISGDWYSLCRFLSVGGEALQNYVISTTVGGQNLGTCLRNRDRPVCLRSPNTELTWGQRRAILPQYFDIPGGGNRIQEEKIKTYKTQILMRQKEGSSQNHKRRPSGAWGKGFSEPPGPSSIRMLHLPLETWMHYIQAERNHPPGRALPARIKILQQPNRPKPRRISTYQ